MECMFTIESPARLHSLQLFGEKLVQRLEVIEQWLHIHIHCARQLFQLLRPRLRRTFLQHLSMEPKHSDNEDNLGIIPLVDNRLGPDCG